MNTPTPETDAAWQKHLDDDLSDGSDPWELASRLERERDQAHDQLYRVCKDCFGMQDSIGGESADDYLLRMIEKIKAERDHARRQAEIERDKHRHPDHGGHLFAWKTTNTPPP